MRGIGVVGIDKTGQGETHRQSADRLPLPHLYFSDGCPVGCDIGVQLRVSSPDLRCVIRVIPATPAQFEAEPIRVEVLRSGRKARCMMCSHEPGRHPVFFDGKVGYACVDVIPPKASTTSVSERSLIVFV
jgi:hypothetical protein